MNATLRSRFRAVIALTRYREVVPTVLVTTLLGANVAGAWPGPRLVAVLLGNVLIVAFAFMFNDVEDAADDALNLAKVGRNPVSAGRLSPQIGYTASLAAGLGALALYATLGILLLVLGALCLALGALYSWRRVRLKAIPVADLISHALVGAALQFLCAYSAFWPSGWAWLAPCLFLVAISMYSELYNELRDLDADRLVGVNHTAVRLGRRGTQALMVALSLLALVILALSVWQQAVPLWTVGLAAGLAPVVLIVPVRQIWFSGQAVNVRIHFHEPVLLLSLIVLLAWLAARTIGL